MKPLLAYKPKQCDNLDEFIRTQLRFPLLATPKIDGIRCLVQNGKALTRSLKAVPNHWIRNSIEVSCPDWIDGELTCGTTFQAVTSGIMSYDGTPNFTYFVFDCQINSNLSYSERVFALESLPLPRFCVKLLPIRVSNPEELLKVEADFVNKGAEGVMLRTMFSPYKEGRSTLSEHYLIAIKRFLDDEAVIIGFEEQLENINPKKTNLLGYTERSSCSENFLPKDTLGSLTVMHPKFGIFSIGTGFNDHLRKEIWNNQSLYLSKLVKFRYQSHGTLNKPRIPIFMGIRNERDI